ncbi:LacI family DNA-binding transcriptional regulator [Micromonospora sp. BRA006-A]|nr:LacI family DNA-binding transcriptional regulator [Micromonospora sp. BRA006-A]
MVFQERVKMSDVARTAGVSVATVSKVVNGRYGVAQATVERVQQVIHELGYEASLGAQSLRSHRTNVLGIPGRRVRAVLHRAAQGRVARGRRQRLPTARLLQR